MIHLLRLRVNRNSNVLGLRLLRMMKIVHLYFSSLAKKELIERKIAKIVFMLTQTQNMLTLRTTDLKE